MVTDPGLRTRLGKAMLGPRFLRKLNEGGNGTNSHEILDASRSKEFSFPIFIDKAPAW